MWQLQPESDYEKRLKRFPIPKKHRRELAAVHDHLDTFFRAICEGAKSAQVKLGCIHAEPHGVLAIDQKGGGAGLKEIRLYTYPDEEEKVLYVLTLGDKDSQKDDLKYTREWVADLRKKKKQDQKKQDQGDAING